MYSFLYYIIIFVFNIHTFFFVFSVAEPSWRIPHECRTAVTINILNLLYRLWDAPHILFLLRLSDVLNQLEWWLLKPQLSYCSCKADIRKCPVFCDRCWSPKHTGSQIKTLTVIVSPADYCPNRFACCSFVSSCFSLTEMSSLFRAGCSREILRGRVSADVWLWAAGHNETPGLQLRGSFSPPLCPLLPEEC